MLRMVVGVDGIGSAAADGYARNGGSWEKGLRTFQGCYNYFRHLVFFQCLNI